MNNLEIKDVEFNGNVLKASKDNDTGKVYVGVSWICNGLGFEKNMKDRQVKNIQEDIVLNRGCVKFDAGVFDAYNSTLVLNIEFLPLWLAKISITPKMKENQPFIVDKLVKYQLEAKDVLAKAFINKDNKMSDNLRFMQGILDGMKEQEKEMQAVKTQTQETNNKITHIQNYLTDVPDRKTISRKINEYARINGMKQKDVRTMIYHTIEDKYGVDIKRRVENKHKQMNEQRVSEGKKEYKNSTLNQKYNAMDFLEENDFLKEVQEILAGF